MAAWVRGERCGVDNCPSRFWILADGQWVCQNGHVRLGVEFAHDEDEFFTGRKLRQPKQKVSEETKQALRIHGARALRFFVVVLQEVYRIQIEYMMREHNVPEDFPQIARDLWLKYLNLTRYSGNQTKTSSSDIGLSHITALLYLTCRKMQMPYYFADFLRWIYRGDLPFLDAEKYLDPDITKRVPIQYRNRLRNGEPSVYLRTVVSEIVAVFGDSETWPPIQIEPFIFRTVRDWMLPPEIYPAALRVYSAIGLEDIFPESLTGESMLLAVILTTVKLCYGLDGIHREVERQTAAADHPDWQVWSDVLRKTWLMDDYFTNVDERDAIYMNAERAQRYMDWYQYMYANRPYTESSARQRMLNLFPNDQSVKKVKVDEVNFETLEELNSLLSETVGEDPSGLSDNHVAIPSTDAKQSGIIPTGPGSLFQLYTGVTKPGFSELPDRIELLVRLCLESQLITRNNFRSIVDKVERRLVWAAIPVYAYMEREGTLASEPPRDRDTSSWQREDVSLKPPVGMNKFPARSRLRAKTASPASKGRAWNLAEKLDREGLDWYVWDNESQSEGESSSEDIAEPSVLISASDTPIHTDAGSNRAIRDAEEDRSHIATIKRVHHLLAEQFEPSEHEKQLLEAEVLRLEALEGDTYNWKEHSSVSQE